VLDALAALSPAPDGGGVGERIDAGQLGLLALGLALTPLMPLPARYAVTAAAIAPSLWRALAELRRPRVAGGVQDAAALALATLAGRYGTAQVGNFLHRLARYLEQEAVEQMETGLRQQVQLPDASYSAQREGLALRCEAPELRAGDRLRLGAGSRVPLQCMVVAGRAALAAGSGAGARSAAAGDLLAAGLCLEDGELEVVLLQDWKDGSYRRLQAFVEAVIREREGAERYATGLADRLAPYSLLVSSAVFGFTRSLRRTSSTLQADFGSSLALVTPVAVETALSSAAAGGILFRSGEALERLAAADCVVFDKTGTLSDSLWHLDEVVPSGQATAEDATTLLARVVLSCLRPQVAGVFAAAAPPPVTTLSHHEVLQLAAQGLQLRREGRALSLTTVSLARRHFGLELQPEGPEADASRLQLCLLEEGDCLAVFTFDNPAAAGAAEAIGALRAAGIGEVHMITHEDATEIPGALRALDLDGIHPGLDELDKQAFIADLEARGRRVVLVSDGLFQARGDCLSVCLASSPEARQLDADVWLLWPELSAIAAARGIAQRAARLLASNQRVNLAGNGAVLLAASFDLVSSTVAAVISNSITLGMLHRARVHEGGPMP
jgi:Cu2+-exporting ATPase